MLVHAHRQLAQAPLSNRGHQKRAHTTTHTSTHALAPAPIRASERNLPHSAIKRHCAMFDGLPVQWSIRHGAVSFSGVATLCMGACCVCACACMLLVSVLLKMRLCESCVRVLLCGFRRGGRIGSSRQDVDALLHPLPASCCLRPSNAHARMHAHAHKRLHPRTRRCPTSTWYWTGSW